jgi:peptidoglycan/LPS O-acetylase OafA/YrhL
MTFNTDKNYGDTSFLTGMRAIAILLVFLIHSGGGGLRALSDWSNFLVDCGKYGVQVFFVISGYTIFSQFFQEKYTLKKFLLVRLTRLSLPYFPILIALFFYANAGGTVLNGWAKTINAGTIDAVNLLSHLTYLSPYDLRWQNSIIGIEWTLGVEVFFYVAVGLLIKIGIVQTHARSMAVFGVLSMIVFVVQLIAAKKLSLDPNFVHWLPFGYAPMFYLGGLAFVVRRQLKATYPDGSSMARALCVGSRLTVMMFFIGIITASTRMPLSGRIPEAFFVVATFITIVTYRDGTSNGLLRSRPMQFMGSISFSFYLLHYLVILFVPNPTNAVLGNFIVQLVISITASVIWCEVFERRLYHRAKAYIKREA